MVLPDALLVVQEMKVSSVEHLLMRMVAKPRMQIDGVRRKEQELRGVSNEHILRNEEWSQRLCREEDDVVPIVCER